MGSIGEPPTAAASAQDIEDREYTVLVTGFGPFRTEYPVNPSAVICQRLPSELPSAAHPWPPSPRIRYIKYPEPIHVAYSTVRELIPRLYKQYPDVDMVLHIGMAGGRRHYTLETLARNGEYLARDVDGELEGGYYRSMGTPDFFRTGFDADDVWRRWAGAAPDLDLRPSEDAGLYLCEYIYYSSLLHFWKTGRAAAVAFLHVPGESSEEDLQKGVKAAITLTTAMTESFRKRGLAKSAPYAP